ncbi:MULTISPECIES: recombinase family protein [Microbacterium]|uniref:recombinase family protein n=1 Tax=Microbacterium TaxID=33882 RepID=UPI002E126E81
MNAKRHASVSPSTNSQRAIALVRVSREREGMTSPEIQRHAIEAFATQSGYTIVDWVEGIDESGSRARSAWWPRLEQSIDRLASGEFQTIIVWKFSRTARNRLRWAVALDRVDTLGGSIVSATEPIESRTASGKFARGLLGEVNAYQADLIGETWRDTHARRVRDGLPANGKPRFGYVYDRSAGFTHDPTTAPVLHEAYLRYTAGESIYALVAWLNAGSTRPVDGYGRKGDGLWSDRTLRRVLDSGFAAGLIIANGQRHPGAHRPLITQAEWDAYLEARERRRTYRRGERSEYLLSGLVWCACGSKMNAGQFGRAHTPKFRCKAAHEKRTHAGGYVSESVLIDAVRSWLHEREVKVREAAAAGIAALPPHISSDPRAELSRRVTRATEKLIQLADQRIELDLPLDVYASLRDRYEASRRAAEAELRTIRVRSGAPLRILPVLLERWEDIEVAEKRELLRAIIARVEVTPKRPISDVEVFGHEDG